VQTRRLTLQSRGLAPASRVKPLISNVRFHQVASPSSFVAKSGKRVAAFLFDLLIVLFAFLVAATIAATTGHDLSSFQGFAVVSIAYHTLFITFWNGQTPGKQAQDICVVSVDGQRPGQWRALARAAVRYIPLALLTIDWRDWVAIEAVASLCIKIFAVVLWLRELALLEGSPTRQTIADKIAGTLVVNLPAPEAHRAPAGPMFSATDEEFGTPPRNGPKQD